MHKSSAFLLLICLLFAGCRMLPYASIPGTPASVPDNSLTLSTPVSLTESSPADANALIKITMPVGYDLHGSWFDLYFTDPTNPAAKQITGGPDGPLAAAIDSARLSVDAAIYSLSLNSIRDALIHAYRRGVQVRIVMESDNMDSPDPKTLMDAGLPILGDHRQGLMHDKFMVIDRSDVWTGSMNFTDDGAYADNNNMIHIRSEKVAEDYETDFDEMFVDGKFGPNPGVTTPNPRVIINGTPLDVYFSPNDHIQAGLIDLLNSAQTSIYFLAYSFTADPLAETIRTRASAGVKVSGVMETEQVASDAGTEYDAFRSAGLDVRQDGNAGLMHHKVMIIDGQIVVMGSYNFSASAETTNDENVIVIYNPDIAAQYLREFQRVYALAKP